MKTRMDLDIEIPKGYGDLKYGPLYLPPNPDHLILIGESWIKSAYLMDYGGRHWIYVTRVEGNDERYQI